MNTIVPQTAVTSFPESGINRSEVLDQFANTVTEDIATSFDAINKNGSSINDNSSLIVNELSEIRTNLDFIKKSQDFRERNSVNLVLSLDLNSKKNTYYAENTAEQNKLVLDQKYGQIYLPITNSTPLFFNEDNSTGTIYSNDNLDVSVVPISEPSIGGYVPQISAGVVKKAFNGQNAEYWARKVQYPQESIVTEVSAEVVITVPYNSSVKQYNVININPFPLGRVDILGFYYRVSEGSTWTLLDSFPSEQDESGDIVPVPIENAGNLQFITQVKNCHSFKLAIRQRNWTIENNKKTFIYGAQEIGARLVEFSTVNSTLTSTPALNNHIGYKIKAPKNTSFGTISKIDINPIPNAESELLNNNHIVYVLSKIPEPESSSDILWTSYSDPLPQNNIPIDLGELEEYFLLIYMKYVNTIKVSTSPFKPGTTPIVKDVVISHTLISDISAEDDDLNGSINWKPRNNKLHYSNLIAADFNKAVLDDGSNCLIFWDDFWENNAWRQSLESSVTNLTINPEFMSIKPTSDAPSSTGVITYRTVQTSEWGSTWIPRRIRIQSANAPIPANGADIIYTFKYSTALGAQPDIVMTMAEWTDIPVIAGDLLSFSLEISLINSLYSQKPELFQFSLLIKD